MAVIVNTGELKHKVVFQQPTSSLNERGGKEISYTDAITTYAKVDRFNQYRTTEANATDLIGALDFTVRWSEDRAVIGKNWLIRYQGKDHVIFLVEPLEQKQRFIRFTAKARS